MRRVESLVGAFAIMAALALPPAASARTQVVWAGGPLTFQSTLAKKFSTQANDFFPRSVTINQGDTISWQGMSINFHSVDLPGGSGKDLPLILPTGTKVSGVNDFAGNPFWFNGLPNFGLNPALFAPLGGHAYNGTTRVDAGLPFGKPAPFNVTFTKPGTYVYFCDLHYDMRGIIVVRPKGKHVPSAAQNAASVAKQVARDTKVAKALVKTTVHGNKISLGEAGKYNVEVLAMFPSTLHVNRGTTVTFSMSPLTGETHTATFGPSSYLKPLAQSFTSAVFDPRAVYASSPTSPIPLSPTSHSNGFANTGPLDRDSSTLLQPGAKITFTKPGVYHFICMVHPLFMHGAIIVK